MIYVLFHDVDGSVTHEFWASALPYVDQVAKVARTLMGKSLKSVDSDTEGKEAGKVAGKGDGKGTLTVMTLLDGGSASRQKKWIKVSFGFFAAPCLEHLITDIH